MKDIKKFKVTMKTIHYGIVGTHTQKCTKDQLLAKAERYDNDPSAYIHLQVGAMTLKSGSAVDMLAVWDIRR